MEKENIAQAIREELERQHKSIKRFAEETGFHRPSIHRILSSENYTIETILSVLHALDLDLEIVHRDHDLR